jgi:hypothetical protein
MAVPDSLMDIYRAIEELKAEKRRLDRAIAALKQGADSDPPRRRRRAWNADARRAAAARMKKYWEHRKQQSERDGASEDHNVSPPSTDNA